MVDLGVYNFVRNALAQGKSKEEITGDLTRGGRLSGAMIEEAFAAVARGETPAAPRAAAAGSNLSFHEKVVPAGHSDIVSASSVGLVSPPPGMTQQAGAAPRVRGRGLAIFLWFLFFCAALAFLGLYGVPQWSKLQMLIDSARQAYQKSLFEMPSGAQNPAQK